jgi:hypothetical protein
MAMRYYVLTPKWGRRGAQTLEDLEVLAEQGEIGPQTRLRQDLDGAVIKARDLPTLRFSQTLLADSDVSDEPQAPDWKILKYIHPPPEGQMPDERSSRWDYVGSQDRGKQTCVQVGQWWLWTLSTGVILAAAFNVPLWITIVLYFFTWIGAVYWYLGGIKRDGESPWVLWQPTAFLVLTLVVWLLFVIF